MSEVKELIYARLTESVHGFGFSFTRLVFDTVNHIAVEKTSVLDPKLIFPKNSLKFLFRCYSKASASVCVVLFYLSCVVKQHFYQIGYVSVFVFHFTSLGPLQMFPFS